MMKTAIIAATALLFTAAVSFGDDHKHAETYSIDTTHSSVTFKIRHFFTPVSGSFGDFSGTIHFDPKHVDQSKVEATISVASVNTNNEDRDEHLQQDDYFNTADYGTMTFTSTSWEEVGENAYKVTGDLTMAGNTGPVTLDVELLGFGEGRGGVKISGWNASGTIDRTKWGVTGGQPVVGDEVEIDIVIQGHLQS